MKFLVDNQLPRALARFLTTRGFQCRHVVEVGLEQASDAEVWRYAADHGMVLITKDEDFLHLVRKPGVEVQVLWVRLGNCRTPQLLAAMDSTWPRIEAHLESGDRLVEIR